jgi:hypothetical protein
MIWKSGIYSLTLTIELQGIHVIFHISQLRKYLVDPDHVVNDENIELISDSNCGEANSIYRPRNEGIEVRTIPMAKVLGNHHPVRDATWETEVNMRRTYPELFPSAT